MILVILVILVLLIGSIEAQCRGWSKIKLRCTIGDMPSPEVSRILHQLQQPQEYKALVALVDAQIKAGKPDTLVELMGVAIEKICRGDSKELAAVPLAWELSESERNLTCILEIIKRRLAGAPGEANVVALLRLMAIPELERAHKSRVKLEREPALAGYLCKAQPKELYYRLCVSGTAQDEMMACWTQELVIRGEALDESKSIQLFWEALRHKNHPLSRLPLKLLEIEHRFPLGQFQGVSDDKWIGVGNARWSVATRKEIPPPVKLNAAVQGWIEQSNGKVEARTFQFDGLDITDDNIGLLLRQLDLECLRSDKARVVRLESDEVMQVLLHAAIRGGAYGGDKGAGYGRLAAFHSLASLSGSEPDWSINAIAEAATSCPWYATNIDSSFFYCVAWDFGLIAVNQSQRRICILAATDAD